MRTESDLVRASLMYLKSKNVMAWRNNTGAWKVGKHYIRFGSPGSGDIFAVLPKGRFLSIEAKLPGKKPTPEQVEWQKQVIKSGGFAWLIYSICDLEGLINAAIS